MISPSQIKKVDSKIRIAFIKFAGLSAGGTERWLQTMAANLPKDKYDVDYYYCDSAPYLGSTYKHADTSIERREYMTKHNVNLIKFYVGYKDITVSNHDWIKTDFWEKFNLKKYDLIQSAKAGPSEYPFNKIVGVPIVDSVHLLGVDKNPNIVWTCFLSEWSRKKWSDAGGNLDRSTVIHMPVQTPATTANLRSELSIPQDAVVAGFHQRPDDAIASTVPLLAFSKIQLDNIHFIIMGGGNPYRVQAKELNIKNVHFIDADNDSVRISSFLNTLDIFAHGRKDGETFGVVLAEAMIHQLPCLSHRTEIANAQVETMGAGGIFANNFDEYTSNLKKLYKDKELREKLGKLGKAHAEKFYTLESSIRDLCKIYEKVNEDQISFRIRSESFTPKNNMASSINKVLVNLKIWMFNKYFFKSYRLFKRLLRITYK